MASMIDCPFCGKLTDPNLDNCPHCGGATPKKARAYPQRKSASRGRQTCPNCKALVQDGDIICVVCGTNLLTGQMISEELPTVAPTIDRTRWIIIGSVAAILFLGVVGLWLYLSQADPMTRAMRLIADGDYLEAQDVLMDYVKHEPDDTRALFELGKLQWRNGRYSAAADTFERTVTLNPAHRQAAIWAVVALASSGAPGSGQARQVAMLERAVEREPNNTSLVYLLGLARSPRADSEKKIEALRTAVEQKPADESMHLSLGLSLALAGDYKDAGDELAISAEGSRALDTLAAKGFMAGLSGDLDAGIELLQQAVAEQRLATRWQALTQLGKLLAQKGQFRDAQPYLEEAIRIRPSNNLALYLNGICYFAQNRPQDALDEFARVSYKGAYGRAAGVQAARIYLYIGDVPRAEDTIERVAAGASADAEFYTVRGRVYAARNKNARAREAYSKALEIDPDFAPAYLESGLLYVKNDDLGKGLKNLERYLILLGSDVAGTRAYEIRALTRQLRQTVGPDWESRAQGSGLAVETHS